MVGEIAEAGGDFNSVSVLPFVVIVLLVIDSVRMTSSMASVCANTTVLQKIAASASILFILYSSVIISLE